MKPQGLMALLALSLITTLSAWATTDGTYVMEGGVYSIDVRFGPQTLTVVEPNKTSIYQQQGSSNEYWFTNTTNQNILYGLRVVDDVTLEAFKPNQPGNIPTTLRLRQPYGVGNEPAEDVAEAAQALADHYMALTESDPINAQTWTQCASVAMVRAMLPEQQADETALQAATLLKMISVDTSRSPCADAIPENIWRAAPTF